MNMLDSRLLDPRKENIEESKNVVFGCAQVFSLSQGEHFREENWGLRSRLRSHDGTKGGMIMKRAQTETDSNTSLSWTQN